MCTTPLPSFLPSTTFSGPFDRYNTFNTERLLPDTEQHHTQNSLAMILSFTVTNPRPLIPLTLKVLAERLGGLEVGMEVHLVAGVERCPDKLAERDPDPRSSMLGRKHSGCHTSKDVGSSSIGGRTHSSLLAQLPPTWTTCTRHSATTVLQAFRSLGLRMPARGWCLAFMPVWQCVASQRRPRSASAGRGAAQSEAESHTVRVLVVQTLRLAMNVEALIVA
jgi:hypothetical protein